MNGSRNVLGHERRIEEGIELFERDTELKTERWMTARVERKEGK